MANPQPTTPWLSLLRADGKDAVSFLQGQLTQDVATLSESRPVALAASCDPKGRVIAILTLIWQPDHLLIALRGDMAEQWLHHVLRYKLRAEVDITPCTNRQLIGRLHDLPPSVFDPLAEDPASGSFPSTEWHFGALLEAVAGTADETTTLTDAQWQQARITAGIADVGPNTSLKFTPHMLNLDRQNAISFNKGCYTGQEIVARTEHLGAAKRRAIGVEADDGSSLQEGDDVLAEGRKVGTIAAANGPIALAVVRRDDANVALSTAATPLQIRT